MLQVPLELPFEFRYRQARVRTGLPVGSSTAAVVDEAFARRLYVLFRHEGLAAQAALELTCVGEGMPDAV